MKLTLIAKLGQGRRRLPCLNNIAGDAICYLYEPVKYLKYRDIQTLSSTIPKKL